jgi:hypothetical protein
MSLSVGAIALFFYRSFILGRRDARRKEREAYYWSESLKEITESQGPGATAALEFPREDMKLGESGIGVRHSWRLPVDKRIEGPFFGNHPVD